MCHNRCSKMLFFFILSSICVEVNKKFNRNLSSIFINKHLVTLCHYAAISFAFNRMTDFVILTILKPIILFYPFFRAHPTPPPPSRPHYFDSLTPNSIRMMHYVTNCPVPNSNSEGYVKNSVNITSCSRYHLTPSSQEISYPVIV
jgi:hypothetical protein